MLWCPHHRWPLSVSSPPLIMLPLASPLVTLPEKKKTAVVSWLSSPRRRLVPCPWHYEAQWVPCVGLLHRHMPPICITFCGGKGVAAAPLWLPLPLAISSMPGHDRGLLSSPNPSMLCWSCRHGVTKVFNHGRHHTAWGWAVCPQGVWCYGNQSLGLRDSWLAA